MTDAVADLIREVLDLARAERDEVIEAILASLEESDTFNRAWLEDARRQFEAIRSREADPLGDAWKAELDRREAEYERGEAELIDNDDVFAWVRASLR